ncbi:hypothetical protein C1645_769329, partial [Glomus cerebriforme]
MKNENKITLEVLNVLFKVFQKYKFENPIPQDTIEIIREYIDSRQITVQFRETYSLNEKNRFEIGWDQDSLLTDLVSLSAKLFKPHIEDFRREHIETTNKWFLDNMKIEGISSQLNIITEIVLNQEKYLPGFKYFYEFKSTHLDKKDGKNDERHFGDLLFVSEVGVLAVIGVNLNFSKNKKHIKEQIRDFKTFANKKFGNLFVAIIGLYVSHGKNDKITLNPIDSFDKKIMKRVKEFVKSEMIQGETSNTDISSGSSYSDSDSKEDNEISDSDSSIDDNDNDSSSSNLMDFFKFIITIIKFITIVLFFDFINKNYFKKEES